MSELVKYVLEHTRQGECRCCHENPATVLGDGPEVDVWFFVVRAADEPKAEEFRRLTGRHKGAHCEMDPLVGEHSYIEVGGWLGDQGVGMCYMALGKLLGLWEVLTPAVLGFKHGDPLGQQLAGAGLVSIVPKEKS